MCSGWQYRVEGERGAELVQVVGEEHGAVTAGQLRRHQLQLRHQRVAAAADDGRQVRLGVLTNDSSAADCRDQSQLTSTTLWPAPAITSRSSPSSAAVAGAGPRSPPPSSRARCAVTLHTEHRLVRYYY